MPEASERHRFFAPECVLSLGNWSEAEVEKSLAVDNRRFQNIELESHPTQRNQNFRKWKTQARGTNRRLPA